MSADLGECGHLLDSDNNRDSASDVPAAGAALVDRVASAVLYEGYILYPYRASAVKNQQRFNFGGLYPPAYCEAQRGADAPSMQTECLVVAGAGARLTVRIRFLHLVAREIGRLRSDRKITSASKPLSLGVRPTFKCLLDADSWNPLRVSASPREAKRTEAASRGDAENAEATSRPPKPLSQKERPGEDLENADVIFRPLPAGAGKTVGDRPDFAQSSEHIETVPTLEVDGRLYQTWQEAVEREVTVPISVDVDQLRAQPYRQPFSFAASVQREPIARADGQIVGLCTRRQQAISGVVEVSAERLAESLFKVRVRISNETPLAAPLATDREAALVRSLASTHTILRIERGELVSLLDPPEEFRSAAAGCRNIGTWPVLVGEAGERHTLLSSPIILYDYPQIAPESCGDLFDGTEIDEILMLRIMTLTDEEKRAMRSVDDRAREILERTELMPPEQWMKLHGAVRGLTPRKETPA